MPHYYLDSPAKVNCKLTRRGSHGDLTIYHCAESNTFWILYMDREGCRFLYRYFPERQLIDKSVRAAVPDDWTGDPQDYYVDLDTIGDARRAPEQAVNLPEALQQLIDNGDRVHVVDVNGTTVGKIVLSRAGVRIRWREGLSVE